MRLIGYLFSILMVGTFSMAPAQSSPNPSDNTTPGSSKPIYAASIPPVSLILRELVGDRAEVVLLMPGSASSHVFEPKPSDAANAQRSTALFYVGPSLDAWAASLAPDRAVALMPMVPPKDLIAAGWRGIGTEEVEVDSDDERQVGSVDWTKADPHFWSDPIVVRDMLEPVVAELTKRDPAGAEVYRANAHRFWQQLGALHTEIERQLAPFQDGIIILFHPSMFYFARRYEIVVIGTVETVAGHEPTPKTMAELVELGRAAEVDALFSEPQLPPGPMQTLASELSMPVHELDPYGGREQTPTYEAFLRYNANAMTKAFSESFQMAGAESDDDE